jgi:hypothetical protein
MHEAPFDRKYPALSAHYAALTTTDEVVAETKRIMVAHVQWRPGVPFPPFSPATTVAVRYFHRRRKRQIRNRLRLAEAIRTMIAGNI